jgi:hypothetical protein
MFPRSILAGDLPFNAEGMAVYPDGTAGGLPVSTSTAGLTYAQYIASLNPLLWHKHNDPSGTTGTNSGSLGSGQNGTYSNATLAQAGQLGAGEAVSWNGTTTFMSVPNSASVDGIATFTWAFLHNLSSAGEGTLSRLYCWGDSGSALLSMNTAQVVAGVPATGAASSVANSFFTFGAWQWTFMTYDDTGDRRIRLYKGLAGGSLTELTYGTQTAATGTLTVTGSTLYIGNRANNDRTIAGLVDEDMFFNKLLTTDQMTEIMRASGF